MGVQTKTTLITEALQLAGDPSLATRAAYWFDHGLADLYASWDWPFLRRRLAAVSLSAGATAATVGDATTSPITKIKRAFLWDGVTGSTPSELLVESWEDTHPSDNNLFSSSTRGTPTHLLVEGVSLSPNTAFQLSVRPWPVPDKAYELHLIAQFIPPALTSGQKPTYPSDQTLIQMVYVQALRHLKDERQFAEEQAFRRMVTDDRVKFGSQPGVNDRLRLAPRRFGSGRNRGRWDWLSG